MANPLRKTMVYLGLADEDYEDELPIGARRTGLCRSRPRLAGARARHPASHGPRRPATTRRAAMNEILTVHPRHYKDAQTIAESFREGVPVIINLSQMSEPDARRLIDFASGLSMGLYGKIERVTNKVFLLSPEHVAVSGDAAETEPEVEAGFFGQ